MDSPSLANSFNNTMVSSRVATKTKYNFTLARNWKLPDRRISKGRAPTNHREWSGQALHSLLWNRYIEKMHWMICIWCCIQIRESLLEWKSIGTLWEARIKQTLAAKDNVADGRKCMKTVRGHMSKCHDILDKMQATNKAPDWSSDSWVWNTRAIWKLWSLC